MFNLIRTKGRIAKTLVPKKTLQLSYDLLAELKVSLGSSRNFSKFQNLQRKEARNFPMSLRIYEQLQPIWVESSEFFQVPRHLSRQKTIYHDSHLASLGASLY